MTGFRTGCRTGLKITGQLSSPDGSARRGRGKRAGLTALLSLLLLLSACGGGEPAEEGKTLQYILSRGTLRIGVIEAPPWATAGLLKAGGIEGQTLKLFARSMNVRPKWYYLSPDEAFAHLGARRLDIVIGGLTTEAVPAEGTALTPPYLTDPDGTGHVMAIQHDASRFLMTLTRYLAEREKEIADRHARLHGR